MHLEPIHFQLSALLFLLLNISTPPFYNLFSNAICHIQIPVLSGYFFNWSISELVMVMSSINKNDDIIRCTYFIPCPSALSSTSTSSTSGPNSGPDGVNCTLLSIFYLSTLFAIGYKTFLFSRCSQILFECLKVKYVPAFFETFSVVLLILVSRIGQPMIFHLSFCK